METDTRSATGVFQNGRVELSTPPGWADGMKVVVTPVTVSRADGESDATAASFQMMREEDWPTTPEGIAALLASWRELEPLEFTPEEAADLKAARAAYKEYELKRQREEGERPQ